MTDAKRTPKLSGSAGVTLIELMVVLVVVAVGILALAAVQTRSTRDVFGTGMHTRALSVAQAQMESARNAGFTSAQSDSGQVEVFAWKTLVTPVSPTMREVRVSVTWSQQGNARSLELNNLLSKR